MAATLLGVSNLGFCEKRLCLGATSRLRSPLVPFSNVPVNVLRTPQPSTSDLLVGARAARNLGTSPWSKVEAAQPVGAQQAPVTWELQLARGLEEAARTGTHPFQALANFTRKKCSNAGKGRATLSDLVWTFLGMFASVLALGVISLHVKEFPVVGQWHQQGLGLLLGSFGTLCVLIFAKPDAEPVRIWNLVAGHVISTIIVLALIHVMGSNIISRALAMAMMIVAMLWTDSVHPPGGALVLMAVDSVAIQKIDWWFTVYPSLTFTFLVLLPLGAATNWLKRKYRFDFPASVCSTQQQQQPELKVKFA